MVRTLWLRLCERSEKSICRKNNKVSGLSIICLRTSKPKVLLFTGEFVGGFAILNDMNRLIVCFVLFFSVNVLATHIAVLETMADGDAKDSLSLLDRQYLTNVLREQAVKELPAKQNYTIMTRENISAMLPPGKAIEDCEGSCLAETGRNIAADYICQARVGRFGTKLTLTAELYETAGNKLIASFNGRGSDVEELLKLIEDKSPEFFRSVKELNEPEVVSTAALVESVQEETSADTSTIPDSSSVIPAQAGISSEDTSSSVIPGLTGNLPADSNESNIGESIPANINDEPAKESGIHWIPLSISAVAMVTGVVLAVIGNQMAKNAAETDFTYEYERDELLEDVRSAQRLRAVGVGVAIAGAVGVCLSIMF